MRIRTLVTTAAVTAALVTGGMVAPANAVDTNTAGVITLSTPAISVAAYQPASLFVNTNQGDVILKMWLVQNGVGVQQYSSYPDASGTVAVSIYDKLNTFKPLDAGTYQIYFTTDASTTYDATYTNKTNFTAAQSGFLTLTVTKAKTKITKYNTKTKTVKYRKTAKKDNYNIANAGYPAKVSLQKKTKGGKWKTVKGASFKTYESLEASLSAYIKYGTEKKRGTFYYRIHVPKTKNTTGANSKAFKIKVK